MTEAETRDAEIALQMQMQEVSRANHRWRVWRRKKQVQENGMLTVWDPIWGEVLLPRFLSEEEETPRRHRQRTCMRVLFTVCPCLVLSCRCLHPYLGRAPSASEIRLAWSRVLFSMSFVIGLLQIALFAFIAGHYGLEPLSVNPMCGPAFPVLDFWGAKNAARIKYWHEWYRLVTPIALHAGWFHLASNIVLQWRLGIVLEVCWGHRNWCVIYWTSGMFASFVGCIFMTDQLSVGSSGALCGLIGAWGPFLLATWNQTLPNDVVARNAQLTHVLLAIVVIIPLSFTPMVDYAAHLSGLAMGAAMSSTMFAGKLQTRNYRLAMRTVGVASLTLLAACSISWFILFTEPAQELLHICDRYPCAP